MESALLPGRAVQPPRLSRFGLLVRLHLAAGPVAAQTVIHTLRADWHGRRRHQDPRWPGGNMPAYYAAPKKARQVPGGDRRTRSVRHARISQRHLPAPGQGGLFRHHPGPVFPPRRPQPNKRHQGRAGHRQHHSTTPPCWATSTPWWLTSKSSPRRMRKNRASPACAAAADARYGCTSPTARKIKAGVSYAARRRRRRRSTATPMDVTDQPQCAGAGALRRRRFRHPGRTGRAHARRAACVRQGQGIDDPRIYDGMPHAFHADYRPSYRHEVAADERLEAHAYFWIGRTA